MAKTTEVAPAKGRHAVTVLWASGALFVVILALLAYRLEAGLDPAIGAEPRAGDVQQRRVIMEDRIVLPPAGAGGTAGESSAGTVSGPEPVPAPQTEAS